MKCEDLRGAMWSVGAPPQLVARERTELFLQALRRRAQVDWHAAVTDSDLLHDLQRKDFSARQWLLGKGVGHH